MPFFSVLTRLYAYRSLVLLLLLGIAAGTCYYLYHDNVQKEAENQSILNYYASQPVARSVDAAGRETVRVVAAPISPKVLAELRSGLAAEMRDGLRKEFGRQAQLLSGSRVAVTTHQQLPTVVLRDTALTRAGPAGPVRRAARAGTFRDQWLSLTGIVTDDSLSVDYTIRNEFDMRAYSRRDAKHWWQFWKPRRAYVDLKSKNPHSTTTAIEAVLIEKQ
jgi:hypothetical protein